MTNDPAKEHLDAALRAYAAGQLSDVSTHALNALRREPSSHLAALLYFLAHWQGEHWDYATNFIQDFSKRFGASLHILQCLFTALTRHPSSRAQALKYAGIWLDALSPDDIRARAARQGTHELRILNLAPLRPNSIDQGASIADRFGPIGPVKSLNPAKMALRWSQPSFHVMRNVSVMPDGWYLVDDERIYVQETLSWPSKLNEIRMFLAPLSATVLALTDRAALVNLPRQGIEVRRPCILLGSNSNYFYWLVDHVARLKAIEGHFDFRRFAVLVGTALPATHLDCLAQLGITPENVIECAPDVAVRCDEIVVPTLLSSIDVLHPAGIHWLREQFGPRGRNPAFPRKVLVSRSKPHRRRFANEREVLDRLESLGFTAVTPDAMAFAAQNLAFQNAEIVIGPFGTCLTPIMFAPTTCATIELIDKTSIPVHRYIENIATQIGQRFESFITRKSKSLSTASAAQYDFEVDPDELIARVTALC
jgi:hypothetical protein